MRGSYFCAQPELAYSGSGSGDGGADDDLSMFFRATYASAPFDRILEGIGRFGDAVREEFGLAS